MSRLFELFRSKLDLKLWDYPMTSEQEQLDEELDIEEFEVTKGDYKTIITYRFNKKGYPVGHSQYTEYIK